LIFLTALVLAACGPEPEAEPAAPAELNGQSGWTAPDGAFTVTIPAGWAPTEDASADATRLLTIASPTQIQGQQILRQCSVEQAIVPGGAMQQELNALSEGATAESLFGAPAHSFSNEIVNGVRVVSFERNMGDFRHLQAMFAIAGEAVARRYTVACGAGGGENAETDIAAMQQFMSSLSINARVAQ
jgi:hypothetical protein